jgi:glycolate oxidase FAD binding subunit
MLREVDLAALQTELGGIGETIAVDDAGADRWSVQGVRPSLVCKPSSAEALAEALARCDKAGAAVIPWGGGTQQRLGNPPSRADVALVTTGLNRILEYEPADLTATVESGMRLSDLQAAMRENGQWLPIDAPVSSEATIGGVLATNASGPRRLKEGGPRDLVIGTRMANVDGALTRAGGKVVKNVTGYDLNKLHIGALGTLGVMVEVSFKVAPLPESDRSWFCVFPNATDAARAIGRLLWLASPPAAVEILNHRVASRIGLPSSPGEWLVLGRATGIGAAVERHAREFRSAVEAHGGATVQELEAAQAEDTWSRYGDMSAELRWSASALTCRCALPPGEVGRACERTETLGSEPLLWAHATGALFWSSQADHTSQAGIAGELRRVAAQAGGQMVVENRYSGEDGLEVWGPVGQTLDYMKAIKAQYDPRGTLNPGRFVGGL